MPPWRQKGGSATPPGKLTPQATGNGPIHPSSMLPSMMPSSWVDASENTEISAGTNTQNTMPSHTPNSSCPKTGHLHSSFVSSNIKLMRTKRDVTSGA